MRRLVGAILGSMVFCLAAAAQTAGTGALAGTVLDASGGGVPKAKVTVRNDATGAMREVLSESSGGFMVPLLPPGNYRTEVTKPGFKTAVIPGLAISVTETARLDITLDVGAVQEQVTVSTEAALLQTESSAL